MSAKLNILTAETDGTFIYALGPGGTNVFQAHVQSSGPEAVTLAERERLARLFAAAPELLEALERCCGQLALLEEKSVYEEPFLVRLISDARAAIAKARGGAA